MNEADKQTINEIRALNYWEKSSAGRLLRIVESQALEIERLKRELSLPWEMKS